MSDLKVETIAPTSSLSKKVVDALNSLNHPPHKLDLTRLKVGRGIGSGAFSTVNVGTYGGKSVAIKKISRNSEIPDKHTLQELKILEKLASLDNTNTVKYFGAHNRYEEKSSKYSIIIVLDYCQGGELQQLICDKTIPLGWKFRIKLAYDAISAIHFIHDHEIIHRDIKSSNFLLDEKWTCKLSDFGAARVINNNNSSCTKSNTNSPEKSDKMQMMTIVGTDRYAAPEILLQDAYHYSVDIFSFGMVLYEIIQRVKIGTDGFLERRPFRLFQVNHDDVDSKLVPDVPQSLSILARQCIDYEATDRPATMEVYEWLQDLYHTYEEDSIPVPPMYSPVDTSDAIPFQQTS